VDSNREFENRKGGRQNGFGRKAGVPNRVPRVVKEAILLAADQVGRENHPDRPFDGLVLYMRDLALHQPLLFLPLLEHVLWLRAEREETSQTQVNLLVQF